MKTLKAIKYEEGYLFVDIDGDPYPLGLHLIKNEVLEVQGVGAKSGEVFHSKGFSYKNEVAKIVGQYNLNFPHIYYVDMEFKSPSARIYTIVDLLDAFEAGTRLAEDATGRQVLDAVDNMVQSVQPKIESIDIETIFVVPQLNGTRSDGKITDEISLNPADNTLEVPIINYKFGKEHLTLININYENLHHTKD